MCYPLGNLQAGHFRIYKGYARKLAVWGMGMVWINCPAFLVLRRKKYWTRRVIGYRLCIVPTETCGPVPEYPSGWDVSQHEDLHLRCQVLPKQKDKLTMAVPFFKTTLDMTGLQSGHGLWEGPSKRVRLFALSNIYLDARLSLRSLCSTLAWAQTQRDRNMFNVTN